jgi:hypothetical protein
VFGRGPRKRPAGQVLEERKERIREEENNLPGWK